jgi:hypothetical protein
VEIKQELDRETSTEILLGGSHRLYMKRLLMILVLLATASVVGADDVTVKLNDVSPKGTHTNIWFECSVTIHNGTSAPLTVNYLFIGPPSLALKISDLDGKELKRVYSVPHIFEPTQWDIAPGDDTFTNVSYGLPNASGSRPPLSLPEGVHAVRVQVQGILPGSSFTNRLTSNIVEVQVP